MSISLSVVRAETKVESTAGSLTGSVEDDIWCESSSSRLAMTWWFIYASVGGVMSRWTSSWFNFAACIGGHRYSAANAGLVKVLQRRATSSSQCIVGRATMFS
ncbi:unnamed protein product [Periconia digitata]|uniref:Uncharacterized protein n=1 Tax=Periconia digitata TaxID=1303443 RepID=A0A9W4UCA3_9PLEO|nr:unnamed protein product [Periconia digitata]